MEKEITNDDRLPRGVFVIPWKYIDWEKLASFLKLKSVNTVILSIKDSQGFLFYPSKVAPHIEVEEKKLVDGIETLHKNNIKVMASIATFADAVMAQEHPDWLAISNDGLIARPQNAWKSWTENFYYHHCPIKPGYQKHMKDIVIEVMNRFNFDGIILDFIRFPYAPATPTSKEKYFCFCDYCVKAFENETGENIQNVFVEKIVRERWFHWRSDQLTNFISLLRENIQNISDIDLMMFIATYGSQTCDRNELKIINEKYGQDIYKLRDHVDVFAPMLYHIFTEEVSYTRQNVFWIKTMTRWFSETADRVWPVLHGDEPINDVDLESALENAINGGASGILIYPGRSWKMTQEKWEKIEGIFSTLAQNKK